MSHPPSIDPFILEALKRGKCLIITGPDLLRKADEALPLRTSFHQAQAAKGEKGRSFLRFYEQEELYLFEKAAQKTRFFYALDPYFRQAVYDAPYRQLSELPVPLFLNGSPDLVLRDVLGEAASFGFFHKGNPKGDLPAFSVEKPLVYNLLGSIDEQESLILTHDDLFQYLERIFAEGQVPQPILDALFEASCLIFLGVGFDKWYVQLLLRLLRVNDERYARYAAPAPDKAQTLSLCTDQFQIEFVNNDIAAFVQALHDQSQQAGLLIDRKAGAHQQAWKTKAQQHLAAGELVEALDEIDKFLEAKQAQGASVEEPQLEVLKFRGELARLDRRKRSNMLTEEAYQVQRNLIAERIQLLIEEIDQDHG